MLSGSRTLDAPPVPALRLTLTRVSLTFDHPAHRQIFESFQDLLLLHQGRVAYFGPRETATGYFGELNVHCPPFYNPADFLLSSLMTQLVAEREGEYTNLPNFNRAFMDSKLKQEMLTPPKIDGCEFPISLEAERGAGVGLQMKILLIRVASNWKRDKMVR